MTGLEIALLVLLILAIIVVVALGWKVYDYKKSIAQWKDTANLYSNMYAESAEILADLIVNGDDFGEK